MLNENSTVPYILQANDTFYKISKYYNITLDDLIEANPDINPDNVETGQMINLPIVPPHYSWPSISGTYTIKAGDTMYKLARKYKVKLSALIKSNPHINPDAPLEGQTICIPKTNSTYHSEAYKVEFNYPVRWAKINDNFYEGLDGFFRLSAVNSEEALEKLCEFEAYHKLKPYGTQPCIISIEVSGRTACIVMPSSDQPTEMNGQSALILKYPSSIIIDNVQYSHLILWADSSHIKDIIETLVLLV